MLKKAIFKSSEGFKCCYEFKNFLGVILFSEILSRLVWWKLKWTEGENERTFINSEVKKILDRKHFIHHPKVIARKSYFFQR